MPGQKGRPRNFYKTIGCQRVKTEAKDCISIPIVSKENNAEKKDVTQVKNNPKVMRCGRRWKISKSPPEYYNSFIINPVKV